jgi:hypothetical protein
MSRIASGHNSALAVPDVLLRGRRRDHVRVQMRHGLHVGVDHVEAVREHEGVAALEGGELRYEQLGAVLGGEGIRMGACDAPRGRTTACDRAGRHEQSARYQARN